MKKTFGRLVLFAVFALVGGAMVFWWLRTRVKESSETTRAQVQREKTIHDLAKQHNAMQNWEKSFTNKTSFFTIDVQDALLNRTGPLAFTGTLDDVRREGERIIAYFSVSTEAPFSISLRVICSEDQRKTLTNSGKTYAIIADIQKVTKPDALNAIIERDENNVEETFKIDWNADTYWVIGRCVELKKLP